MKNKLLIAAILFSILLNGCGDSGDSSPAAVDDSEYEETELENSEGDLEYENADPEDTDDALLDEMQETEVAVAYELENICTGISDAGNGYKAEYTISTTN